jgi:hypothetical protein
MGKINPKLDPRYFLGFALKLNNIKMRNKNNFGLNIYFQNRQKLRFLDVSDFSSIKYAYEIKLIYSEKATET